MDLNLVLCLRTDSLSQVSEGSKARKEASFVSCGRKDARTREGVPPAPPLPLAPLHLDVQIELLPEVVVQGRDLGLKVLILYGAVRQGLQGGMGLLRKQPLPKPPHPPILPWGPGPRFPRPGRGREEGTEGQEKTAGAEAF